MLPDPTERLRFRRMRTTDLDDVTALLVAFDPMRRDRLPSTRGDAVRWIEWQERNQAEHGFGLWVVETHDGAFVRPRRWRTRLRHAPGPALTTPEPRADPRGAVGSGAP
ncbi:hypothetical protein AAII07_37305 [Microvirga sp. 0TCS3.31]